MRPWELDARWARWARLKHSHSWDWVLLSTCAACRALMLKEVRLWS